MKQKLKCILVIDDDEPTNFFTRMIIDEANCTNYIKIAESGQEALDYLAKCASQDGNSEFPCPDLILLDINMPAMNGWEFLEEYKKVNNKKNRVMTVMLTTSLFPEDKARASEMPEISGFENKPLTGEKLDSILKKHFGENAEANAASTEEV
jgi:CheY-like chemotaxis protein